MRRGLWGVVVMTVSNWKVVKLSELAEIQTGISKSSSRNLNEPVELPYLRVANVQDGYLHLDEIKTIKMDREKIKRYLLKYGDVLMTEGGDFDKLGRGAVWREEIKNCLHQNHVFSVRPNKDKLLSEYLSLLTSSDYGKRYFIRCSKQSTNLASINTTQLKAFPVLLPDIVTQKEIVCIFQTWDTAIEKTDALIAAKERQFGWLVKRIYKNLELPKESKTTMSCHLHATSHIHGDKNAIIASVGKKGIRNRSEVYSKSLSNDYSKNKLVYKDEIAFGLANDSIVYGVNLSQEIFSVSSAYKTFKILGCDSRFLKYLLDTNNSKLSLKYLITSARQGKSVDFDGFLKEKFVFPEISKQKHISNTINTAQQEITLLKNLANQYRTQKRGLMQKLLSGEWQLNPKEEKS